MKKGTRVLYEGITGIVVFESTSTGVIYNDVLLDTGKRINNRYDWELEIIPNG